LLFTKIFRNEQKSLEKLGWINSLFIGVFQALAILPGVSRSGATISAGLFAGLKREDAFKFSFLLAIPAILGAMVLQIFEISPESLIGGFAANFIGFITAAIFGFLSLKILERIIVKGKLHYFAIYCFSLGIIIFIFNFIKF